MPSIAELNPRTADVMSPQYWEKLSKTLPPDMRKEYGPMIQQVKQYIELEAVSYTHLTLPTILRV